MSTPARLEERIDVSAIVSDANSLGSSVISVVQTALGSAEAASASSLARSISSVVASAASGPEASSILASLESELASTSRLSSLLPSGVTATEWSEASVTGSPGRTLSTTASTPVNTAAPTSPNPSVETSNGIGSETNHHTAKTTKIALGVSIPLGIILIAFLIFAAYLWGKRTASRQHSKEKNEFASGADDNNSGEALGHHDDAAHGRPPDEAEDDESRILPPESAAAAAPGQKQLEAGVRMTIRHVRHELPSSPDSTMTSSSAAAPWNLQQQRRQQQDDIAEMPTEFNITELPSPVGEVEEFYRYPAGLPAYEQHGRFR
ncbi:hypothetical protein DBV05_g6720 [Lasiodiplodia theobromae]|uniref:Mid2 domain-containing protein n=1 Tax=Lasiodiplodia theobromae TaxID=45133 RepID=A0A5N5DAD1_9PEZI|nr:hypothetical protein DBV05_g6720 [Lasiodiplodia theobromae]